VTSSLLGKKSIVYDASGIRNKCVSFALINGSYATV
jgi:hypothetical protein